MYLKKVEIQGFKSFGDVVQFKIPEGITVVVGPNGCGKSNIADAMRWVLGEQSAKLLRGTKMEDVIFAGTQNRKALGYAQVSMTIDNSKKELPIDYSEVVITRRVYRSGESEYFINQSICRLRDIQELFMDTGVGKEGYSIIGQGQIDKVLSSKPEDRRSLFEEAAGIYKFKMRKIEAEKKLEKERENLTRIQDILLEIESRLEPLQKQAKQAKQYLHIKESLKEVELNVFIYEVDQIEKELTSLTQAYETLQADYASNDNKLQQTKELHHQIRIKIASLHESSAHIQNAITDIRMNIEKLEGTINVHHEKVKAIDTTIQRLEEDKEKRNNKTLEQKVEKQMLQSKKVAVEIDIKTHQEQLTNLQNNYEQITYQVTKTEEEIQEHKSDIYNKLSQVADVKASIEKGITLAEQMETRQNQMLETANRIKTDIKHQETRYQVLSKNQKEFETQYTQTADCMNQLNNQLQLLEKQNETLYINQRNIEDSYHKAYSRYHALSQMKNEHEGFQKSVKSILLLQEKNPTKWNNIYGVVGNLISVPKHLEVAIDVALGNSVQHIVTKDEETAQMVIEYIKKHQLGRATFLPLSSVKPSSIGTDANHIINEKGVIGFANRLISYEDMYNNVISNLLGRVVIVDCMDNAIQLARKYQYRYRIVTIEGEVLNPGGSITGGAFHKNRENIFSRNREINELDQTLQNCKKQLHTIANEQKELDMQKQEVLEQLQKAENEIKFIQKNQMELDIQITHMNETLQQIKLQELDIEHEKQQINDDYKQTLESIESRKKLLSTIEEQIQSMEKDATELQQTIEESKKQKEAMSNQITELKVSLSAKEEILRSHQEQIQRISNDIEQFLNEKTSYEAELEQSQNLKLKLQQEIKQFTDQINEHKKQLEEKNNEIAQLENEKSIWSQKENENIEQQAHLVERNSLLQAEIYRVENKITKSNLEKENIFNKVWEEYEATYQTAMTFKKDIGTIAHMRKIANDYKAEIRTLGIINVAAIQEYDETRERYEFLSGHEQDILKAEQTLLQLIEELTSSMEEMFATQFEQISQSFNRVFTELFGGGRAFLQLTDAESVLESGIDIIAQPPGKKLQNMTLLSGGERALTAIAILFGILSLKPSPFCILDEIEAALDDANVVRFSSYLKNLRNQMQFIVITHRKGTMEVADTMYGVTMEEQGVSKIVSVQLDEIQNYTQANAT